VTEPDREEAEAPSLATLLRALIEDVQTLVEAEAGFLRAALAYALNRAKSIALLLVLALFFAFFTLMAIVVGLLLALAPLIGPWGALGLMTVALGLLGAVSLRLAIRRGQRMIRLLIGPDKDGGTV
jgi:hypothetical protein